MTTGVQPNEIVKATITMSPLEHLKITSIKGRQETIVYQVTNDLEQGGI
jgi:hypothetical protein